MFSRLSLSHCLFSGFLACALPVSAATLFSENFTGDTVGQTSGIWRAFNTINVTGATYGGFGTTSGVSSPTGENPNPYLYAQNNTPSGATTTVDYFLFSNASTAGAGLFTGLTPSTYGDFTASWQQNTGGTVTGMTYYFTVLVNGTWYATASGTVDVPAQNLYSIDLLNATWYAVDFTQGSSLALNTGGASQTSSALFGGGQSITGVGFYVKNLPGANAGPPDDYRTIRFDNLTLAGTALVPEPGRALLLSLALGTLLMRRRRV